LLGERWAIEYSPRIGEIKSALLQRSAPFLIIVLDPHRR
jgi:hypothetical protein